MNPLPPVADLHSQAVDCLFLLRQRAADGDEDAAKSLRNLGIVAADFITDLALDETKKDPRGGVVRQLARESLDWPFRLSAIDEKRHGYKDSQTGQFRRTVDNPEVMVEFLRLGSETEIQTSKNSSSGGRSREFQGRSGFALRAFKQIQGDLKGYAGLTAGQLRKSRYHSWKFNLDPKLGPVVPVERSPALQCLLQTYIERARKLKTEDIDDLTDVAILCFRVQLEDDLERVGYWPSPVEDRKLKKDGTYEANLKDYLKAGFKSIMKKSPRNLSR